MVSSAGPPEGLRVRFNLEVDAIREVGDEELDVWLGRGGAVGRRGHVGAEDAAFACFGGVILLLVECVRAGVDGDADAEAERVACVVWV